MSERKKNSNRLACSLLFPVVAGFIFTLGCNYAIASDLPLLRNYVREDGKQKYKVFCRKIESNNPNKIKCQFQGVEFDILNESRLLDLIKDLGNLGKPAKLSTEEVFGMFCSIFIEFVENAKKPLNSPNPFAKSDLKSFEYRIKEICSVKPTTPQQAEEKTRSILHVGNEFFDKTQKKCCSMSMQSWEMEFTKISENKWTNSPVPSGLCNILKSYIIERQGEFDWKMTEIRISGDTESEQCKSVANELLKPTVWSTKGSQFFELPCDFISWDNVSFW